jgi:hypothetical protein
MKVFDEAEHDRSVVDLDKYMTRLKARIEGTASVRGKA